jgi:hypothetical protein
MMPVLIGMCELEDKDKNLKGLIKKDYLVE